MNAAVLDGIIQAAADEPGVGSGRPPKWTATLRDLVAYVGGAEQSMRGESLNDFAALGVGFASGVLDHAVGGEVRTTLTPRVQRDLAVELHRTLSFVSRGAFQLTARAESLACESLGIGARAINSADRLCMLFTQFPVLGRLWAEAIDRWCITAAEFLRRLATDRAAIARAFFDGHDPGQLRRVHAGLSDPHHDGRTVILLRFARGAILYKPRSGAADQCWNRLIEMLNEAANLPHLRAAFVLSRPDYCWAEHIARTQCDSVAAVQRFYRRAGMLAAAAHLAEMVDCHRGNLIAAGEMPVIVDAETLLHPRDDMSGSEIARTGFFAGAECNSRARAVAALSPRAHGAHVPRLHGRYMPASSFARDIAHGFAVGWQCLVGTASARRRFSEWTRHAAAVSRRRIDRPTRVYAAILRSSVQPAALRSAATRWQVLRDGCDEPRLDEAVRSAETHALWRLDIPHFAHDARAPRRAPPSKPPAALLAAIGEAVGRPRASFRRHARRPRNQARQSM